VLIDIAVIAGKITSAGYLQDILADRFRHAVVSY
jgi:hypothetical protein